MPSKCKTAVKIVLTLLPTWKGRDHDGACLCLPPRVHDGAPPLADDLVCQQQHTRVFEAVTIATPSYTSCAEGCYRLVTAWGSVEPTSGRHVQTGQ